MLTQGIKARFIEPMLLQRVPSLPEGTNWAYEVKLDGYRALAIKSKGKVLLRSRNNKDFSARYPSIVRALGALPEETVIDGEIVALDETGRPSFNALQNLSSSKATLVYYVFDVPVVAGKDVMREPPFGAPRDIASPGPAEAQGAGPRVAPVERQASRPRKSREGARLRGHRRKAAGQPVRARPALRGLAQDAG